MTGGFRRASVGSASHRLRLHFQTASRHAFKSRGALRSRFAFIFRPREGVGTPGARCTRGLVCVTTSTPESPDVPARNGFTTYFVLSPVTGLFCHRRQRIKVLSKPGRADLTSANLTPASGCQDHTTSPYAATSLVRVLLTAHKSFDPPCDPVARKTLPRPPHPSPRS
jgi:hypothetical protein